MAEAVGQQGSARSEYERIVQSVRPLLVYRAMRMTHDRDQASDLVQATLEKGYRAFDRFRVGTNAAGWLSAIMTNFFLDERRRERLVGYAVPLDRVEIPNPSPERVPAWSTLCEESVRKASARLPEYCRRPFEMHSFDHLSYRDIAAQLRLPMNTVCSRIHRARLTLRRLLLAELAN